jgi:hypothetical protein
MEKRGTRLVQRGFTLITALAFTLVVGTILAGVGTVAVSHLSRSKVEGTYANSIALADAGINVELARISSNTADATLADQAGSAREGSIAGIGDYSVYVIPWGSNCDGTGTWKAPGDMCILSTGKVDGISRTVRVRGIRKSIFDEYALFAYIDGTFSGGGVSSGSTEIVGNLGANGAMTFNGALNTGIVNGMLELNGSATSSDNGSNVLKNPDPVIMPDVSAMANLLYTSSPGGLAWVAAHNNNANIKRLSSSDPSWAAMTTVSAITAAAVQALPSAGFTSSSRTLGDPSNSTPSDTSTLDTSAGPRFFTAADATYKIDAYGVNGKKIYILPPGDYYLNNLSLSQGTSALVLLTHLGQIRIWIDNPPTGKAKDDTLGVPVIFTDTAPSKFRLFYNKCANLTISGNGRFNGGFYALNSTCGNGTPNMKFTGDSMIYGSVITDYFTVSGGTKVVFPNDGGGADPTDFSLWFGFKDHWKEVNPSGNPVFVDGTSN